MVELKFQFQSMAEFMQMSGHGPYVWACYAIGLACLLYMGLSPLRKRKVFLRELQRIQRIEDHAQAQREQSESE